jgi:hypothetical protein
MKPRDTVRTRHDEWVKRALALWLGELGDVEIDARIAGQSRRGDVLFTERRARRPAVRRRLGTLGDIARGELLLEAFRNAPSELELKGCVLKAIDLEAREARAARRARQPLSTAVRPALCAILPSMSRAFALAMGIQRMPGKRGLHTLLGASWRTAVVVANELPKVRASLWLRLLGRGKVQAEAVKELAALSEREPLRDATLELLVAWQQSLPPPTEQSEDERELTMNLAQVYEKWERKTLAKGEAKGKREGKAEGKVEGKAEAVLRVLDARGLTVTAAQRKQVLACTDGAQLDVWLDVVVATPSAKALLTESAPRRARVRRG